MPLRTLASRIVVPTLGAALVFVGGCTSSIAGNGAVRASSAAPSGSIDPADLADVWTGSYVCTQGITGLRLTIKDAAPSASGDPSYGATFAFFADPRNPGVPTGSYAMKGAAVEGYVTFTATTWATQPPGYVLVDLSGPLPTRAHPDDFSGTVLGPGCTTFTLTR